MSAGKALAIAFRKRVLDFWFTNNRWSQVPAISAPSEEADLKRWFGSSKELDQQIREHFEEDLPHLVNDEYRYPDDLKEPEQLLACIIALDQFPRNIYRNDARAFAFDNKARELSLELIRHQVDKQLPYVERAFVYMPFEHSEKLEDQNQCVDHFKQLLDDAKQDPTASEALRNFLQFFIKFSEEHRTVIQQFGRFPHRNAVLQRPSTPEEETYLKDGGARFGQ